MFPVSADREWFVVESRTLYLLKEKSRLGRVDLPSAQVAVTFTFDLGGVDVDAAVSSA